MALFIDWNPLILYSRSERKLPNSACAFLKLVTLICNVYVFLIYASLNLITLIEIHIYFIIYQIYVFDKLLNPANIFKGYLCLYS